MSKTENSNKVLKKVFKKWIVTKMLSNVKNVEIICYGNFLNIFIKINLVFSLLIKTATKKTTKLRINYCCNFYYLC